MEEPVTTHREAIIAHAPANFKGSTADMVRIILQLSQYYFTIFNGGVVVIVDSGSCIGILSAVVVVVSSDNGIG